MVDRAMLHVGGTRLAWVPTIYWTSSRPDRADVTGFCFMDGDTGNTRCLPATQALIDEFRKGLQLCMQLASDIGINEHAVVPHLDESTRLSSAWRNAVVVSPLQKYKGFTYEEALLNPIADALGSVAKPFTKIYFALQGEMSATVMRYPHEYSELIGRVRQRIIRAAQAVGVDLPEEQVQIGLSWNYNAITKGEVDAELTPEVVAAQGVVDSASSTNGRGLLQDQEAPRSPSVRVSIRDSTLPPDQTPGAATAPAILPPTGETLAEARRRGLPPILAPPVDMRAVRRLLSKCDFIGISAYASLNADFSENELQNSAFTFYNEFKQKTGINLAQLMQVYKIPLHYSEFGLGGGMSMDGSTPAETAAQAALKPFFGMYPSIYEPAKDPWRQPQVRSFMESFWAKTLSWLSKGGGPTYHITACFSWTLGSYDIFALYPESSSPAGGSYFQPQVAQAVKQHNTAVSKRNRELDLLGVSLSEGRP